MLPDPLCWCADIHTLLADIGMEQESFESAMTDHKQALELLSTILQVLLMLSQQYRLSSSKQLCLVLQPLPFANPSPCYSRYSIFVLPLFM